MEHEQGVPPSDDSEQVPPGDCRPVIEYVVPQLCDVSSVQVRTDRFDDVWLGRVRDSDNPQETAVILADIDALLGMPTE